MRVDGAVRLRGRILECVAAEPGIAAIRLSRLVEAGRGTVSYHLQVLEKKGLVREHRWEGTVGYHVISNGAPPGQACNVAAALRCETARLVLAQLRSKPGVSKQSIARSLGLARNAVSYHIRRLAAAGAFDEACNPGSHGLVHDATTVEHVGAEVA